MCRKAITAPSYQKTLVRTMTRKKVIWFHVHMATSFLPRKYHCEYDDDDDEDLDKLEEDINTFLHQRITDPYNTYDFTVESYANDKRGHYDKLDVPKQKNGGWKQQESINTLKTMNQHVSTNHVNKTTEHPHLNTFLSTNARHQFILFSRNALL